MPKKKIKRERKRLYEPVPPSSEKCLVSSPSGNDNQIPVYKESKREEALAIIKKYMNWSTSTALIPIPIVDMTIVTAIQLRMLKSLSILYNMEYSEQRGKALIAALISGLQIGLITGSFFKIFPVIGLGVSVMSMAILSGAITYAVGIVFMTHFESGGNLNTFKPENSQKSFGVHVREGQRISRIS